MTPTDIALRVTEARKPSHHFKVHAPGDGGSVSYDITPILGIGFQPHFQAAGIYVEGISNDSLFTDISPSSIPVSVMRFDLTKLKKKSETNPEQYKQLFLEQSSSFPNHIKIFTDGSKCSKDVAAVVAADGSFQSPL